MTSTTVARPTPAVPRQQRPGIDTDRVADLIGQLLVELGEDPQRDGLAETPKRVAAWWNDFHAARCETFWTDLILQQHGTRRKADESDADEFRLAPNETLAEVLAAYAEAADRTDAVIAGISDLGQAVPVPQGAPWIPAEVREWSIRWVLLHLIEETARHGGHADVIRESVDGATFDSLLAAAEAWPDPWVQPWEPASPSVG
ncbi:mycothiol transferase [Streptomyces cyaneofuscatus]|uniref:mycothiol transferase n=1 Tax=Streptomyces cyaneofuscatus TaxID=66883 RepID=UPI0037D14FE6